MPATHKPKPSPWRRFLPLDEQRAKREHDLKEMDLRRQESAQYNAIHEGPKSGHWRRRGFST